MESFELINKIGQGNFSKVYHAIDINSKLNRAIKITKLSKLSEGDNKEALQTI